eukprot:scaffold132576_cov23-Tisochrysis_lutea.AAC.2
MRSMLCMDWVTGPSDPANQGSKENGKTNSLSKEGAMLEMVMIFIVCKESGNVKKLFIFYLEDNIFTATTCQ